MATEHASAEPQAVDLLVSGADILTFDTSGTVVRDGAIAVSGSTISWVGPATEAARRFRPRERIDASGRILMPGLIDAHFHTAQQFLRGKLQEMARRQKLRMPPWKNYYVPFEGTLTPDDVYYSGLAAYAAMISVGTTCFLEAGGPHADDMGRAADEIGIRGCIALSTMDHDDTLPASMRQTTDQALKANEELVLRWRNHPRVQGWLALRQIIVTTETLQKEMSALAASLDTRIHTHLAEGTYEVDYALAHWGCRPAERLAEIGVFNERLHTAHAILLSPEEMDLYERHDVSACHCASNNYGIGHPRMLEMHRRGIRIGMGTDGAASWGPLDMFQMAHAARIGQQLVFGTPVHFRGIVGTEELLTAVINGGARAAGLIRQIGSLESGKRADFILVATDELDQFPVYDPVTTAGDTVVGRDVRTVVIDGRVVMKEREILTVDVEAMQARIKAQHGSLMERFEAAVA